MLYCWSWQYVFPFAILHSRKKQKLFSRRALRMDDMGEMLYQLPLIEFDPVVEMAVNEPNLMEKKTDIMETLEFYSHGPRKRFPEVDGEILATIITMLGSARVYRNNDDEVFIYVEVNGVEETFPVDLNGDNFMGLAYFDYDQAFFMANNEEYLLMKNFGEIKLKGTWPGRILAMKMSSGEKLALYQENDVVVICNLDIHSGYLTNIFTCSTENLPENVPVTWGPQSQNYKRSIMTRESNYVAQGNPTMSWTESDDLLVVNVLLEEQRHIIIFSDRAELLYKSEPGQFRGLEKIIAFRPDGALIGCVLSEDGVKQELVLVQKNLEILYFHTLDSSKVMKLEWSPSSEVLGVFQKDGRNSRLDLYMISSTKFYLKQRVPFLEAEPLLEFTFRKCVMNAYNIEVCYKHFGFRYTFIKKLLKSDLTSYGPNLTIEVDGPTLDIYLYSRGVLPPRSSQSHNRLVFNACVMQIAFDPYKPRFAIIDINYNVAIYSATSRECILVTQFTLNTEDSNLPFTFFQFFFKPSGKFCAIRMGFSNEELESDYAHLFSDNDYVFLKKEVVPKAITKGQIVYNVAEQEMDREKFRLLTHESVPVADYMLLHFRKEFAVKRYCDGDFAVNEKRLNAAVTSLHFTPTHLLITKHKAEEDVVNDYLVAMELTEENFTKLHQGNLSVFDTSYSRPIEKGTIILNNVPKTSMIVMLLPRGNTECIHLRSISLQMLHDTLLEKNYLQAFNLIKFESLGFNLLVDIDPAFFKMNFEDIFYALHESALLFKFIMELVNHSTLTGEDRKVFNPEPMIRKRFEICNNFVEHVLSLDDPMDYLCDVAISALCCQPEGFNYEKALDVISSVVLDDYKTNKFRIIQTIKMLNPYFPYELQYKTAIDMYNLDLAEVCAERSEMDPQVYRPYINKLKTISPAHARQTIALNNGKTTDASMFCLDRYDNDEITLSELLNFAMKHDCFDSIYLNLSVRQFVPPELVETYSAKLQNQRRFKDAGIVLNCHRMYREAVDMFMQGLNWQDALTAVNNILGLTPEQRVSEYGRIAKTLSEHNKFKDAAFIYHNYCRDSENAIANYLKAQEYRLVYMLFSMSTTRKNVHEALLPMVMAAMDAGFNQIEASQKSYRENLARLRVVREKKNQLMEEEKEAEEEPADQYSEGGSVRTSTRSSKSSSSRTSSKRRAKEERKMLDTKPGSKYEDIALMRVLHKIIEDACEIINTIEDQSSVVDIITSTQDTIYTNNILRKIHDYKRELFDTCDEIWPSVLKRFEIKSNEEAYLMNISELDLKYRWKPEALQKMKKDPV